MGFDFGDALDALMSEYGDSVTLVGDGWRYDTTGVVQSPWVGANANGIPVSRTEPMATLYTEDVDSSGLAVGDELEHGLVRYRVLGIMQDDYGASELLLKEEA